MEQEEQRRSVVAASHAADANQACGGAGFSCCFSGIEATPDVANVSSQYAQTDENCSEAHPSAGKSENKVISTWLANVMKVGQTRCKCF